MSSIKELSALPDGCPIDQITLTVKHPFPIKERETTRDGKLSKWKSQGAYVTDEAGDECSLTWNNPNEPLQEGEVISVGHYNNKGCSVTRYTSKKGTPEEHEAFGVKVSGGCLKRQGETVGQAPAQTRLPPEALATETKWTAGKVTDQQILEALPRWFDGVEKSCEPGQLTSDNMASVVCSMLIAVAKGDVVIEKPAATTSNTSGQFDSSAEDDDIPF